MAETKTEQAAQWTSLLERLANAEQTDDAIPLLGEAHDALKALLAEIADLRSSVLAFAASAAVEHARAHGLPAGHLHPTHYDILARAGGRMTSFVRAELPAEEGR